MAAVHGEAAICRQIREFIRKRIREQLRRGYRRVGGECLGLENEDRCE